MKQEVPQEVWEEVKDWRGFVIQKERAMKFVCEDLGVSIPIKGNEINLLVTFLVPWDYCQ